MDLAMAYDSARGRMVLFGGDGYGTPSDVFFDDTWELGLGITTASGSPVLSTNTTQIEFGHSQTYPVGVTSSPIAVHLFSAGTGPLTLAASTTSDFSVGSLNCPAGTDPLAAGGSCFLLVYFTPTVAGDRNGSLNLTFNGAGSPVNVPIHGIGQMSKTSTTMSAASGVYGGTASLVATVVSNGAGVAGLSVAFSVSGSPAGSVQTDAQGVA